MMMSNPHDVGGDRVLQTHWVFTLLFCTNNFYSIGFKFLSVFFFLFFCLMEGQVTIWLR